MNDQFDFERKDQSAAAPQEPTAWEPPQPEPTAPETPLESLDWQSPEAAPAPQEPVIPHVEAERVENPIYSQTPYSSPYQAQQPAYTAPQPAAAAPAAPEKKRNKGGKIFLSCIALLLVFALGVGVASIFKKDRAGKRSSAEIVNSGAPEMQIAASPVTPTALSAAGEALTPAQIAAKVADINVGILVSTNSSSGEGSGIVMGEDESHTYTYIITCAHVISSAGITVRVQMADGTTYDAEIVGFDTQTDIGVVRIKATGLTAAEFGDSDALVVGDPVYAIGNPGGTVLFGSFTTGYVSAISRSVQNEIGYTMECIQHNAAISPGNSGGALVNQYGQVVGINSQKIAATNYEGLSFAVPITQAKAIIDDLIKYSYVTDRAKLGITYAPVSASQQYYMIAQIKGLPAGTLIITDINADSTLVNTEARKYDMIIAVNGKQMDTADVLLELIDNGSVGDQLTLTLCRVNSDYSLEEITVEATLVEDRSGSEEITTTTQQYVNPFDFFSQYGF